MKKKDSLYRAGPILKIRYIKIVITATQQKDSLIMSVKQFESIITTYKYNQPSKPHTKTS